MELDIIIASIGVFIGELYGNMVGGGSLVTQTVLQNILHIDIKSAMALDNTAVIGSNIGMMLILARKYKVKWWYILFTFFQIAGAVLGSLILVNIDKELLQGIFIVMIILLVIKNLFIKDLKHKEKGFQVNGKNIALLSAAAIFIGAYNGAFVIGDWIVALLILTSFFSIKYHNAVYLLVFSVIFSQPMAAYQYYTHGLIDFKFIIPMITATICGGILAGLILDKIHYKKLETFLKYLSVVFVIYLIWGLAF